MIKYITKATHCYCEHKSRRTFRTEIIIGHLPDFFTPSTMCDEYIFANEYLINSVLSHKLINGCSIKAKNPFTSQINKKETHVTVELITAVNQKSGPHVRIQQ